MRRAAVSASLVLDAGALIALDRGDERTRALLVRATTRGARISIPAGALAQAWRDGRSQARLARLVTDPGVEVVSLDKSQATASGSLCGLAQTSDIVDASVVVCARLLGNAVIVTSDPDDLRRLDPKAKLAVV